MKTKTLLPLSLLSEGATGTVVKLNGGRTFQEKMISMGITQGNIVEVLSGTPKKWTDHCIRSVHDRNCSCCVHRSSFKENTF